MVFVQRITDEMGAGFKVQRRPSASASLTDEAYIPW